MWSICSLGNVKVAVLDDLQRVVITFQCVVTDLRPQENVILMSVSIAG